MPLPQAFCWSKIGTEAGEDLSSILARKDHERSECDGVFLWGIGNSIGPSLRSLLDTEPNPQVVFSPMRSPAAAKDRAPEAVVAWQTAFAFDGGRFPLPPAATVTSSLNTRRRHYALVCRQEASLLDTGHGLWIDDTKLRNLRTGSRVGSSQVTSVVRRDVDDECIDPRYRVAFTASLEPPFLVVLEDPTPIDACCEPEEPAMVVHERQASLPF